MIKRVNQLIEHGLSLHQHNIGYMADGFYNSKDPTTSIKVLKVTQITQLTEKYNKHT